MSRWPWVKLVWRSARSSLMTRSAEPHRLGVVVIREREGVVAVPTNRAARGRALYGVSFHGQNLSPERRAGQSGPRDVTHLPRNG